MSDLTDRATPVQSRLAVLDALRGLALCGILLMNIVFMAGDRPSPPMPAVMWDPDWTVWFVQSVFFEGTMRGLFTLLFGAGIILMTARDSADTADVYFRRCLMLMVLGLVNVVLLIWPGDILYIYGFSGLFLFVFRKARPRTLLILAGAALLVLSAKGAVDARSYGVEMHEARVLAEARVAGKTLSEAEAETAKKWTDVLERQRTVSPRLQKMREQRTGGWESVTKWSWSFWTEGISTSLLDLLLESGGFILVGMALTRMGAMTGERSLRFYALLALGGYAVGLPMNLWEAITAWNTNFAPDNWTIYSTYQIDRLAMTIGHLGLFMLLWKADALAWISKGLIAIGRMGLTNYLGQSLVAAVVFYGFGVWGHLGWAALWAFCVGVWLIQGLFSVLYLRRFSIGPAEWLLRSVAYGRRLPMRDTA